MFRPVLLLLLCLVLPAGCTPADPFGAAAAGLPALPSDRTETYEFYKLDFLPDGYPGRQTENGTVAHPIYGAYVVLDYLRLYAETDEKRYLAAAQKVADATLAHMEPVDGYDALAFYYEPDSGLSYYPGRFYSGLTQVRYLNPLFRLSKASGDERYAAAARRILNSLKVPQTEGGVAIQSRFGPVIEEYPHEIPSYVLNGWTTIVLELLKYADAAGDSAAGALARANVATMEQLLPRYDVPELLLSRYQLTGFAYVRLVFSTPQACRVDAFETVVDGTAHGLGEAGNRWTNFVVEDDLELSGDAADSVIQINGVFSQIEDDQSIAATLDCRAATTVDIYTEAGDYDPLLASMPTDRWIWIGRRILNGGENRIALTSPSRNFRMVGYPTNFAKEIGGKNYNVYHWLHITNMQRIAERTGSEVLAHFAAKWTDYARQWDSVPQLAGQGYSFDCVSKEGCL